MVRWIATRCRRVDWFGLSLLVLGAELFALAALLALRCAG